MGEAVFLVTRAGWRSKVCVWERAHGTATQQWPAIMIHYDLISMIINVDPIKTLVGQIWVSAFKAMNQWHEPLTLLPLTLWYNRATQRLSLHSMMRQTTAVLCCYLASGVCGGYKKRNMIVSGKKHWVYCYCSDNTMHCGGRVVISLLVRYLWIIVFPVCEVYKASMFTSSLLAR